MLRICFFALVYLSGCNNFFKEPDTEMCTLEMPPKAFVRQFLASDYTNPSIAKQYFTPEFAALWSKACSPPEGEAIYWGADPILETQDIQPKLLSVGPQVKRGDQILIPVQYQHRTQHFPKDKESYLSLDGKIFTKTFVLIAQDNWKIADIQTSGLSKENVSELERLKRDFGMEKEPSKTP